MGEDGGIKVDKVLVHVGGGLFCDYVRGAKNKGYTHKIYISNAEVPPTPKELGIGSRWELEWAEVRVFTRPLVRAWEQESGAFDFANAEFVK